MHSISMRSISSFAFLCFLTGSAAAADTADTATAAKLSISGKLEFEVAELLKARTTGAGLTSPGPGETIDHIWFGHGIATLNFESNPVENFKVRASLEFRQYRTMVPLFSTTEHMRDPYFPQSYWNGFYVREGQGIFSILKNESLTFDMTVGFMPYKYNPEVRNLGEFLFRSGTYPLYLLGEFNRPFARLTGLCLSFKGGSESISWKIDGLGLLERDIRPINDVSFAAIAGINLMKMIDIGGGVDFARIIPVDSRLTTPNDFNPMAYKDNNGYVIYNSDSTQNDTAHYTFQGTKIMARATIDPFGMLRGQESAISRILGESGGKIFGEYAIIGLKNYPGNSSYALVENEFKNARGYAKMAERSPWMVGVTIPAWKALDVCVLEFERFPGYFTDSYFRAVINGYPQPARSANASIYDSWYVPRWNWSLYMKKQIVKNFSMVCQTGRDHQRWEFNPNAGAFYDFESAFVKPDEWGWHLAGVFTF